MQSQQYANEEEEKNGGGKLKNLDKFAKFVEFEERLFKSEQDQTQTEKLGTLDEHVFKSSQSFIQEKPLAPENERPRKRSSSPELKFEDKARGSEGRKLKGPEEVDQLIEKF